MERTENGIKDAGVEVIQESRDGQIYGKLSHREAQLLLLFFQCKSNKEAAVIMGIKPTTVYSLWANILFKLGCHSAAHAIAKAVSLKMIKVYSILSMLAIGGLAGSNNATVITPRQIPRTARVIRSSLRATGRLFV